MYANILISPMWVLLLLAGGVVMLEPEEDCMLIYATVLMIMVYNYNETIAKVFVLYSNSWSYSSLVEQLFAQMVKR